MLQNSGKAHLHFGGRAFGEFPSKTFYNLYKQFKRMLHALPVKLRVLLGSVIHRHWSNLASDTSASRSGLRVVQSMCKS